MRKTAVFSVGFFGLELLYFVLIGQDMVLVSNGEPKKRRFWPASSMVDEAFELLFGQVML